MPEELYLIMDLWLSNLQTRSQSGTLWNYTITVGIFVIENTPVKHQGEVLISEDGGYTKAQIIGIQVNDEHVNEVSDGEIGLKFSAEITKKSEIWIL